MATITCSRLRHIASLHGLWIAGLVAVLLFASGNAAYGQASKKSPPASNNRTRPASSPRVATGDPHDASPATKTASADRMTIERVNQLTGFVPASEEEVKLLVEKMQTAVAKRDSVGVRECFDQDELLSRTIAGAKIPSSELPDIQHGYRLGNPTGEIAAIASMRTTNHQLFQMNRTENEIRPVFRTVSKVGGLVYNELVIQADRDNGPKIVDVRMLASGDYLSLMTRPLLLGGMVSKRHPNPTPATNVESDILIASENLADASLRVAVGNISGAIKALDECPLPIRNQPRILIPKCAMAKMIGVNEFRDRVEEVEGLFPDAPFTELLRMEVCRVTHQEADQMEIAERIMKTFDDPFLHYYRVKGLVKAGRLDEARQAMDAAKGAAPTFVDVHVADVELLLIEGNHDRTMKAIESVESTFGDDVLNLASYEGFENFSQSPIGRDFLARRAGFEF